MLGAQVAGVRCQMPGARCKVPGSSRQVPDSGARDQVARDHVCFMDEVQHQNVKKFHIKNILRLNVYYKHTNLRTHFPLR